MNKFNHQKCNAIQEIANNGLKNSKKSNIPLIYDAIEYISAIKYRLARLVVTMTKCILIHSDNKIRYMRKLRRMQLYIGITYNE